MRAENKDKRISTLSFFSNIEEPNFKKRLSMAMKLTDELFENYPYADTKAHCETCTCKLKVEDGNSPETPF